jgi:putative ABC transport system permease protein
VAAGLLAVTGVLCLATGIDPRRDQANPVLVVIGTVAVVLAVPLASPLAIRVLVVAGARAGRGRLALRDLARYQARSGAALAAISLALGIAVAAVVAAAAAEHSAAEGNLPDRQLLFRVGDAEPPIPERSPAELARLRSEVDRLAVTLDRPTVVALDAAVDPAVKEGRAAGGSCDRGSCSAGQSASTPFATSGSSTSSTPELLGLLGLDAARAGWLVVTRTPPTSVQLAQARQVAADAGMTLETRDGQTELTAIRSAATGVGMLLALGILAMTVGLIRSEAVGDLRTLTAAGATGKTRRNLTAATSGALALLGALIGATGAYLALVAGYRNALGALGRVPVGHLAVTLVGLPLTAAAASLAPGRPRATGPGPATPPVTQAGSPRARGRAAS